MDEHLAPRVEDRQEADLGAEVAGVVGDRRQWVGDDPNQETVDDRLVLHRDLSDRRRNGEEDVEVLPAQQLRPPPLEPHGAAHRLTAPTVAVATRAVPHAALATAVTLPDVSAAAGAPPLDSRHHAALCPPARGPRLGLKGVAVAPQDLRHGDRCARHDRRSRHVAPAFPYRPRERVQPTPRRANGAGGDPQVARRGLQAPMAEQELNRAQVPSRPGEMDGKGTPQLMGRHR